MPPDGTCDSAASLFGHRAGAGRAGLVGRRGAPAAAAGAGAGRPGRRSCAGRPGWRWPSARARGRRSPSWCCPATALPAAEHGHPRPPRRLRGQAARPTWATRCARGSCWRCCRRPSWRPSWPAPGPAWASSSATCTLSRASADRHARLARAASPARRRPTRRAPGPTRPRPAWTPTGPRWGGCRRCSPTGGWWRRSTGTITRRNVDRGALVQASSTALFEIAQTRTLKVFVDVPQSLAGRRAAPGMQARGVRARGARRASPTGKVVRTAGALDPGHPHAAHRGPPAGRGRPAGGRVRARAAEGAAGGRRR